MSNKIKQVKIGVDIAPKAIKVKLTKVENSMGKPHPNNLESGYTIEGNELKKLAVGESYSVKNDTNFFISSTVTEVLGDGVFKTRNSTYKIDYLK